MRQTPASEVGRGEQWALYYKTTPEQLLVCHLRGMGRAQTTFLTFPDECNMWLDEAGSNKVELNPLEQITTICSLSSLSPNPIQTQLFDVFHVWLYSSGPDQGAH